jgi:hypothetical protein
MPTRKCRGVIYAATVLVWSAAAAAQPNGAVNDPPKLNTHQSYIEDVMRPALLDVKDPMAVFAFVLNSLPERVKVYPTENYYYFTFNLNGSPYAGNIRLDASDRDQGKVQFGYYEQTNGWRDDTPITFRVLDASSGVKLEKVERFLYRLTYAGKSVLFELNDLSQVRPPAAALAPREKFIGPIFDDSGIRFFLVYNPAIKNFLYILDETVKVADDFFASPRSDRILIGKRSGFVFYRDLRLDRKILIGVYDENVRINNYFDGPFDQLPDNFIEGEALRSPILEIEPRLKGEIDRFGGSFDGEIRYSIAPYKQYKDIREFNQAGRCAGRKHASEAAYYRCFVFDDEGQNFPVRPANNVRKLGGPSASPQEPAEK